MANNQNRHTNSVGFALTPRNACYRNVAVLLLLHTAFEQWFSNPENLDDVDCCRELQEDCAFCEFRNLVTAYWYGDRTKKDHESAMAEFWKAFEGSWDDTKWPAQGQENDQQDVLEFLRVLLKLLNLRRRGPGMGEMERSALPPLQIANVGSDFVKNCTGCGYHEERHPQAALFACAVGVNLAPPVRGRDATLEEAMNYTWCKDPGERCPKCPDKPLQSNIRIDPVPEVLMVMIEGDKLGQKSDRPVDIPAEFEIPSKLAVLPPRITKELKYQTRAVVFHIGENMGFGHYTVGVLQENGTWAYLDNDKKPRSYRSLQSLLKSTKNMTFQPKPYIIVGQRELEVAEIEEIQEKERKEKEIRDNGKAILSQQSQETQAQPSEAVNGSVTQAVNGDSDRDVNNLQQASSKKDKTGSGEQGTTESAIQPGRTYSTTIQEVGNTAPVRRAVGKESSKRVREEDDGETRVTNGSKPTKVGVKKRKIMANIEVKVYSHEYGYIMGRVKIPMETFAPKKADKEEDEKLKVHVNIREEK
ncbi:hypothetical protein BDV18DRAFT_156299 [Aspergillus unguis]